MYICVSYKYTCEKEFNTFTLKYLTTGIQFLHSIVVHNIVAITKYLH